MRWVQVVSEILSAEPACVRVVVAEIRGSAPREVGASMVIGAASAGGTIGGGMLEFVSLQNARKMLQHPSCAVRFETVPLGPNLGQCCGGQVTLCYQRLGRTEMEAISAAAGGAGKQMLLTGDGPAADGLKIVPLAQLREFGVPEFAVKRLHGTAMLNRTKNGRLFAEPLQSDRSRLFLFGAGHVGKELVHVLSRHELDVHWFDQRAGQFPEHIPANTHRLCVGDPVVHVSLAPQGTDFLVVTHDHALDLALCDAILRKGGFRFLGLIGSATKHARFLKRLREAGHGAAELARITCPIGLPGLASKKPEVIAVSIAAQLLSLSLEDTGGALVRCKEPPGGPSAAKAAEDSIHGMAPAACFDFR